MGDPVTTTLIMGGAQAGMQAFQARSQAKAEAKQAKQNAFIGRTRAMQSDTVARQGLESELGSIRTALAGDNQRAGVGTLEVIDDLRQVRDRERRINVGARMAEASDFRQQANNATARGRNALTRGLINAGPSMFDLYQYKKR